MPGQVYAVFCTVTGKYYVGQTWFDLKSRWYQHRHDSTHCLKLLRAIRKYGEGAFVMATITTSNTQVELDRAERHWIEKLDSIRRGYNIREGGSRGRHTSVTRKLMSNSAKKQWATMTHEEVAARMEKIWAANRGRKQTPEERERRAAALRGRHREMPVSATTRARMSAAHVGKVLPAAQRRKIGEAQRGRKMAPRQVEQLRQRMVGNKYNEGKHLSMETRRKISEKRLAYWAQQRAQG